MSPRTKEQNERMRAARMKLIRQAAYEVYLDRGIHCTEMNEIAIRAGVARASIYYYYQDKWELFRLLFLDFIEHTRQWAGRMLDTGETPAARLQRHARFYMLRAAEDPSFLLLSRRIDEDLPAVFGEHAGEQRGLLRLRPTLIRTFREGMTAGQLRRSDPSLAADLYWGGLFGAMASLSGRQATGEELEARVDEAVELLFDGLIHEPQGNDDSHRRDA
ncbi:TetR/AcrR family transcriptional regulator [Paenibacillus dendritiformis]|uniref:TetR/AcrR family transcriptional regulator n=1 Tax=Paenibacillus dendritiformis TaxID=130049 RepID=UPI00143D7F32|nr:TetR/AcrR family transcriptional regulator [Paenibacillus dendritiformis]NKI20180.1 TetR/AcrR family transcriptional regulator [Paenibacillus dendritiformis]NRG01510.1 TetR/AcrR family transcriptional regulator [Paenibacillus dendritiformis]